jgi:hypothetical protein
LNVGVTLLLLLKLETNNKLNTTKLQIMVNKQGAWSMVKLAKVKGSSKPSGKSRTYKKVKTNKLNNESKEWRS